MSNYKKSFNNVFRYYGKGSKESERELPPQAQKF